MYVLGVEESTIVLPAHSGAYMRRAELLRATAQEIYQGMKCRNLLVPVTSESS